MPQNIKIAVDIVVFGHSEKQLHLLLIKRGIEPFKNTWALPGGLVLNNENLEDAAKRELHEETGMELSYIEQLYTFGNINRDPRNRVVSVAYFGLVNPKSFNIKAGTDAHQASWFLLNALPSLAFDHAAIIETAKTRLKNKLSYQPIGFDLLDTYFPFSDLEQLYQSILDKEIDRRNFRKKILSFGFIEETKQLQKNNQGRPGKLFTFNEKKYKSLLKEGFHFEIK